MIMNNELRRELTNAEGNFICSHCKQPFSGILIKVDYFDIKDGEPVGDRKTGLLCSACFNKVDRSVQGMAGVKNGELKTI